MHNAQHYFFLRRAGGEVSIIYLLKWKSLLSSPKWRLWSIHGLIDYLVNSLFKTSVFLTWGYLKSMCAWNFKFLIPSSLVHFCSFDMHPRLPQQMFVLVSYLPLPSQTKLETFRRNFQMKNWWVKKITEIKDQSFLDSYTHSNKNIHRLIKKRQTKKKRKMSTLF